MSEVLCATNARNDGKNQLRDNIQVIRRYSGGGTVLVDDNTLFVSILGHHDVLSTAFCGPREIMSWSARIYEPIFGREFNVRENIDYVLGDKKFGGNAQKISRQVW